MPPHYLDTVPVIPGFCAWAVSYLPWTFPALQQSSQEAGNWQDLSLHPPTALNVQNDCRATCLVMKGMLSAGLDILLAALLDLFNMLTVAVMSCVFIGMQMVLQLTLPDTQAKIRQLVKMQRGWQW